MKQTMFALLDNVIGEIKTRFNEKNTALAKAVVALFDAQFPEFADIQPLTELLQLDQPPLMGEILVSKLF